MNLGSFLSRLRLHLLPVLVWLGALACVVVLFSRRSQRFEVLGIAQGQIHQVAATCPARLKSVSVRLFDTVTKGQTIAVANTVLENEQPRALLQAQLETALAEIEHLTGSPNHSDQRRQEIRSGRGKRKTRKAPADRSDRNR